MIETHAHIYAEQFKEDIDHVLERSQEAGIEKIVMPNIDHTSIDGMMELEERNPSFCYATMGLHPCSVKKDFEKELYIIEEWLGKREFVAIGEMGTDLYWDKTFQDQQVEAFKIQVEWAKQFKKPIIIHCRESLDLTIDLVESLKTDELTGVFHCFNGSAEQAERIVGLDFYLGLGGVTTFKNAGMDKVVPELDLERIVLETDSPYLAPTPNRGKRNEPAFLELIAQKIADYRQMSLEDLKTQTTSNAIKLFQFND
ncbi:MULTISPECIES: TatD family hydrolase [Roseivirga]|jgi:TatD DNase family protein|uniref:Hydrolase TatD n=1 Tax=Roseivirga spongicola TaxID=333140 RepID=A0A150XBB7_9BACT|nr:MULTISPECIES: TatD family hydrolase [Roseivirga]PWL28992.1 MAG: TatD family deoxyribonuclease [Roseivirga sp. XM-24bin3]KYG76013.1 hydrolase TatD [Roseivirga spongicola]MBO6659192.1 TatD family hydrolase [Roseivirga sp.]MBO6760695.1 TatD family hydrolase [Roseivirga sp.]MBO6908071.1 TatD family hydrolase [Roseivirga sp.]